MKFRLVFACAIINFFFSCKDMEVKTYTWKAQSLPMVEIRGLDANWPYGFDDALTKPLHDYSLGLSEVPYPLWEEVREWGEREAGYTFHSPGKEVGQAEEKDQVLAVAVITWGDAVIWCNAATELYNRLHAQKATENAENSKAPQPLKPAYYTLDGKVLRSASFANLGKLEWQQEAKGFRLPSNEEWELAARWDRKGRHWLEGENLAASRRPYYNSVQSQRFAWFEANSQGHAQAIAQKEANRLGVYDMSGNLAEWVWNPFKQQSPFRTVRGGAYNSKPSELQVAASLPAHPEQAHMSVGFRLARSL